jgi:mRNA interferase RelE/StbE
LIKGQLFGWLTVFAGWLAENLEEIKPKALTGELSGLYKLREGDYRIIYEIVHKEKVIILHSIGHRREVYQKK